MRGAPAVHDLGTRRLAQATPSRLPRRRPTGGGAGLGRDGAGDGSALWPSPQPCSGSGLQLALAGGLITLLLVIAVVDVQCRLVLDRLTYPGLVIAPLFAWLWPGLGVRASLLGGLAALVILGALVLLYRRGMGPGDVKLATLIGLYLGWPQVLPALS